MAVDSIAKSIVSPILFAPMALANQNFVRADGAKSNLPALPEGGLGDVRVAALEPSCGEAFMPSSEQSMRARSQHQRPRDVFQCQHEDYEAVIRQHCCRRGSCWHALTKPARRMARDANQPPGPSHVPPLAARARATAPGASSAFLACMQPRALCTQARVLSPQRTTV